MNPSDPVDPKSEVVPTSDAPAQAAAPPEPPPAPKIIGYCRECGKALDETSAHRALGTIYCERHRPAERTSEQNPMNPAPQSPFLPPPLPYTAPSYHAPQSAYQGNPPPLPSSPLNAGGSPALAFVLGMIPGVGAVYNGQYAKGLMHVVILGLAISVVSSGAVSGFEPLMGLLISCFWFYMAFEAYHTAKKRQAGMPVDEFSSVFPLRRNSARAPVGPIVLIVLGVLFLLSNLEIIEMRKLLRYWPALLIVMGVYMIYARLTVAEGKHDGH